MATRYWGITLDDAIRALCERDKRITELEDKVRALERQGRETQRMSFDWMRKHDELLGFIQADPSRLKALIESDLRKSTP